MNALVVDDSRAIRTILGGLLRSLGFEVAGAGDGREALEVLDGSPAPRLILVDRHLPGMDGLAFLRAARARPNLSGSRLLIVSGDPLPGLIDEAKAAGADACLAKPFTLRAIAETLRDLGFEVGVDGPSGLSGNA